MSNEVWKEYLMSYGIKPGTQHFQIMNYLRKYECATSMDAFEDMKITKLATRISEIKRKGLDIASEDIHSVNMYGKPITYSRYRLGKQIKNDIDRLCG